MTQQDWLESVGDVAPATSQLLEVYGKERIDEIAASEQYRVAKATLAVALNEALNKIGGTARKRRRAAAPLFDDLLSACAVIYMLGYDQGYTQGQRDTNEANDNAPFSTIGGFDA